MSGSNSLLLDATPWQTLRHPPRDSAVSVYLRRSLDRLQARVFMQAPFVAPRIMAAVEHRHPGSRVNLWLGIGRRRKSNHEPSRYNQYSHRFYITVGNHHK
jgi:hypothetical protein